MVIGSRLLLSLCYCLKPTKKMYLSRFGTLDCEGADVGGSERLIVAIKIGLELAVDDGSSRTVTLAVTPWHHPQPQ